MVQQPFRIPLAWTLKKEFRRKKIVIVHNSFHIEYRFWLKSNLSVLIACWDFCKSLYKFRVPIVFYKSIHYCTNWLPSLLTESYLRHSATLPPKTFTNTTKQTIFIPEPKAKPGQKTHQETVQDQDQNQNKTQTNTIARKILAENTSSLKDS